MSVIEKSRFVAFLEQQDQETWNNILKALLPSIHPVDRTATKIWFGFWPLELTEALRDPVGPKEMARIMDLEGEWHLDKHIDSSVEFLYGAKYWPSVKKAVLSHAESSGDPGTAPLEQQIRDVAGTIAAEVGADTAALLGITAVAFMILQQVGDDALRAVADRPAGGYPYRRSPEEVVQRRERGGGKGPLSFFQGANRKHRVTWDEKNQEKFKAFLGEDLASAAARVERDFLSKDYRRPQGPIPVECRVGSCGYCWVGILNGKDNLTALTDYERQRLRYFGYDQVSDPDDPRPPIRLACQARCEGDVTVVIPPWNGELKRRFDKTRGKLGTV